MKAMETEAIPTARLTLLPLLVEHAEEMAEVLSDPDLHTFIGGAPSSPEALRSRYERLVAGSPDPTVSWCNWVIQLRDQGHLAGTVQATVTATADDHGSGYGDECGHGCVAEIAWVVGTAWQRRGIASEAARGLVSWLGTQSVQAVIAHIHPDHHTSAAVATAAGLAPTSHRHEGETRWQRTMRRVPSP
ncbi:N-acetyltransferase [Streptomyces inhibens]|uniref:N-acetyltransferase n=1 Tax=Streptomyces inhibens TaxID=2293571 RepID=A0A371QAT0_STRIH|nr:GNAT family N-acetyltransferase [Streptomyces inhibens]REK91821.1 N-acetyltransferase [Streptomyces inhibens]